MDGRQRRDSLEPIFAHIPDSGDCEIRPRLRLFSIKSWVHMCSDRPRQRNDLPCLSRLRLRFHFGFGETRRGKIVALFFCDGKIFSGKLGDQNGKARVSAFSPIYFLRSFLYFSLSFSLACTLFPLDYLIMRSETRHFRSASSPRVSCHILEAIEKLKIFWRISRSKNLLSSPPRQVLLVAASNFNTFDQR